ncbi:MAG: hypothetical protein VXW46_04150, partial [Pseudomonadota bacterium]|nr:hypothetical protein [Pseudomonadota bacterium]
KLEASALIINQNRLPRQGLFLSGNWGTLYGSRCRISSKTFWHLRARRQRVLGDSPKIQYG